MTGNLIAIFSKLIGRIDAERLIPLKEQGTQSYDQDNLGVR